MNYTIKFERPTLNDASRIVREVFKGLSEEEIEPAAEAHIQGTFMQVLRNKNEVIGFANYELTEYLWQ